VEDDLQVEVIAALEAALQWSHADEGVEDVGCASHTSSAPTPGFNGATPMKAWKTELRRVAEDGLRAASMEPRR